MSDSPVAFIPAGDMPMSTVTGMRNAAARRWTDRSSISGTPVKGVWARSNDSFSASTRSMRAVERVWSTTAMRSSSASLFWPAIMSSRFLTL